MTIEMLTKLLVIRIVARSRCGSPRSRMMRRSFCLSLSASVSFSFGERENMATSLPEAKPLMKSRIIKRHPTPTVPMVMGFSEISVRLEVRMSMVSNYLDIRC